MALEDLLARLMTEDELAASRVGVAAPRPLRIRAAETVTVTPADGDGSACELVVVDAGPATLPTLPAAVGRLTRDGVLVAAVPCDVAKNAARTAMARGTEWAAVLDAAETDRRYVVAARGCNPAEFGPPVADHVVCPPGDSCVHLPQNRIDRGRRCVVRRHGRARLLALAEQLEAEYGDAVARVVAGIELLVGERGAQLDGTGSRPAMFSTPHLRSEPWPDSERLPGLAEVTDICRRHTGTVCAELRELVANRPLDSYLQHDYITSKVQLTDPDGWTAIQLFDEGRPTEDLPPECRSTRAMLAELAPHISGEAVILRLAPGATLQPHHDENDYQQTLHLGLSIPSGCGIRVGGEARTWRAGEPLVFSPAFRHEAWNHGARPRDVLLIDLWHPDLGAAEIEALKRVRAEVAAIRREHRARAAAEPQQS